MKRLTLSTDSSSVDIYVPYKTTYRRHHGCYRKTHNDQDPTSASVRKPVRTVVSMSTNQDAGTSTRSRLISQAQCTSRGTKTPKQRKIYLASESTTVLSAQSGSSLKTALPRIPRASLIRGGTSLVSPIVFAVSVLIASRLKQLREGPYTHKEADAAVGLWTDNGKERTKTQEIEMT